jgi:hypothetical protein
MRLPNPVVLVNGGTVRPILPTPPCVPTLDVFRGAVTVNLPCNYFSAKTRGRGAGCEPVAELNERAALQIIANPERIKHIRVMNVRKVSLDFSLNADVAYRSRIP